MLAAIASAILIVAGSLLVGQAVMMACGRGWTWLAGPVGFALILVVTGVAASLEARGTGIAVVLGLVLVAASAAVVLQERRRGRGPKETLRNPYSRSPRVHAAESPSDLRHATAPLGAAVLAALFAALPFVAAGAVGILGVGLVNDDMASHLLIADWIDERFRPEPVFIDQGYPLGPHALVAGLSTLLHASSIDVFAGLVLALPMLTALVAFEALVGVRTVWRVLGAVVVALPYMAAAYLAQEAFKEPILALFVLSFALLLGRAKSPRDAVSLGVLAAGAVYVYSFPGVAWLAGAAVVWAGIEVVRGKRVERSAWIAGGVGVVALLVLIAPEIPRLLDFKDFRALDPDRANEGGLGNLREQVSPLTAFGIWPTSEFRLPAGAGSLPAVAFYFGALVGAVAFVLALPRWIRRYGPAIPAALLAAIGLYIFARAWGTVYTSAKAIAIAAPLITLVIVGGLLVVRVRALAVLAGVVAVATAFSSFLILRQAPVAPEGHMDELAEIRPLVEGEKLLFLGRDNFVLYELRGSKPFTHVRNFYNPFFVEPNFELENVGSKFDFDAVTSETLERFRYVLTTRARYASAPSPGYELVKMTPSYFLWERGGRPGEFGDREPAETGAEPGRLHGCPDERLSTVAYKRAAPVVAPPWDEATIDNGETATTTLSLPSGTWDLSLRYDATRPVSLTGPGYEAELPGNLDYRGTAPFWDAGEIDVEGRAVRISAEVEEPPLAGRLLGSHSVAHLGSLAATPRADADGAASGCDAYVDFYIPLERRGSRARR